MDLNKLRVFVIILLCKLGTVCRGQVVQFGSCGDIPTQQFFQLNKFIGLWYVIQRFPAWYEDKGQCASKVIVSCEKKIEIQHIYVKNDVQYILYVNSTYNSGDEAVFNISENNIDPVGIPLSVIGTDYQNYALIYGCRYNEEMNMRYISSWILSRNRTLEESILQIAYDQLATISVASLVYYETVVQDPDKCHYEWTAHVHAENINNEDDKERKKKRHLFTTTMTDNTKSNKNKQL